MSVDIHAKHLIHVIETDDLLDLVILTNSTLPWLAVIPVQVDKYVHSHIQINEYRDTVLVVSLFSLELIICKAIMNIPLLSK
jgi:hypothetical protein